MDLFYGMMLPSGNDAAYQLAEFFGFHLRLAYQYGTCNKTWLINDPDIRRKLNRSLSCFLFFMNKKVVSLKMKKTHFANPHGLMNNKNFSNCEDLAKLC